MNEENGCIRIGSSLTTPVQPLMELTKVQQCCPTIKFQIVPFENTPENAKEILANLGKNIDIVGGIFDDTMLKLRNCDGLELCHVPFCCAMNSEHTLAKKEKLQLSDLYGENLLLMHRGWSRYVDGLREDLLENHPEIQIVDFDFYSIDIFNHCQNSNDILLVIGAWKNIHPLLKVIPVEWEHTIPYGILHSSTPSKTVQCLLNEVEKKSYYLKVSSNKRSETSKQVSLFL